MGDLHDLTALEQAAAIRTGRVSPVELVEHYLARIGRRSDELGAFVTVTAERARSQARAAERAVRERPDGLPPLHGVPTAIKDLNLDAGTATMLGSRTYADFVAPLDDHVTAAVKAAGMISLGKTNTPEFGLPCYTEPDVAPAARTPWDTSRSAGGSSGGAGTAVAAGLVPLAQGSDGGGSIRIPASVNGVFGLKPSRGRVSNGPVVGDTTGLVCMGPLARSVRDAAAFLDAVSTPIYGDPWPAPKPPVTTFLAACDREPTRLRIGRYRTPPLSGVSVHPDCVAAYDAASALLDELGHEIVEVDPPFSGDVLPLFTRLWTGQAAATPVDPDREDLLRPLTRHLRARGREVTAPALLTATSQLQALSRQAIQATAAYDVVLTPTLAQPPMPVGAIRNDEDPAADFAAQAAFTPFTAVYNVTGQPACSVPLHWNDAGLPIGVMLIGRPAGEETLLALAAQLEAARPWRSRTPPGWD